jgi:hypothetical protein
MGEAALELGFDAGNEPGTWRFRLAQQAYAALLEDSDRLGSFRIAALRTSARTALSALSVDDRGLLERWIALQLATSLAVTASNSLGTLATVDSALAANIRAKLPQVVSSLTLAPCGIGAAA